jgi:amidophosphoribosyltransferase
MSSPDNHDSDMTNKIFKAMEQVMSKCKGGYAGLYLINGIGLVGFRDPHGIRPIVFGSRPSKTRGAVSSVPATPAKMKNASGSLDYVMASESVAIDTLGFNLVRDIKPGEAIFIDFKGNCHTRQCHANASLAPCIFEYVYFARPDSIMDGVSVYESRLIMGEKLAHKIMKKHPDHDIDVVIPIPDTSRTSALQAAYILGRPFREGFIKNRYIARTFIMPGQETRKKSVRLKLNTIKSEFAGRNVLLVDDSVVRGTTAREIVDMAREAGARNVYFASAAPAIRFPNIYGIDIPTRNELVAFERDEKQIAEHIGCDWIEYQDTEDLEDAVRECCNPDFPVERKYLVVLLYISLSISFFEGLLL